MGSIHICMFFYSYSSFSQACTAMSPDDQLCILKDIWNKEKSNAIISKEDKEIIKYYFHQVSSKNH